MHTEIFESYETFLLRSNKAINGVTPAFALVNKDYNEQNQTNKGCFNCLNCIDCVGCLNCSKCYHTSSSTDCTDITHCRHCNSCTGCFNCSNCSQCYNCKGCNGCSNCNTLVDCALCFNCAKCKGIAEGNDKVLNYYDEFDCEQKELPSVPVLKNIHSSLLDAINRKYALDMDNWHTCNTTHCRAGWITVLAGYEGKLLEQKTDTAFAAMLIYSASSNITVAVTRYFDDNEEAVIDIKRCALLEQEQQQSIN